MSNANEVRVSIHKEASYGVLQGTPEFQEVGYKTESFKNNTGATDSAQVRASRESSGKIQTSLTAGGDLVVEMQPKTYSEQFEALLQTDATWAKPTFTPIVIAGDGVTVASSSTATGTITSVSQTMSTLLKGMFVKVTSTPAGQEAILIVTEDATADTVKVSGIHDTHVGTSQTMTLDLCTEIQNGTDQPSFAILKEFKDLIEGTVTTPEFHLITGLTVGVYSQSVSPEGIIDGTFTYQGEKMTRAAAGPSGFTNPDYVLEESFNAITSVQAIVVDPDTVATAANEMVEIEVTEIGFNMSNNLRDRLVVGRLGPTSIGSGQIQITGTLAMFFDNEFGKDSTAMVQANIDFTDGRVLFAMTEKSTGEGYAFDFARVNFDDIEVFGSGINTDTIASATFSAKGDTTLGYTIRIGRFS